MDTGAGSSGTTERAQGAGGAVGAAEAGADGLVPPPAPAAEPPVVWVDGSLSADGGAVVDALDHGMTTGDGVFETCRVSDGVAFALTRHLVRLARSADGLGLPRPDEDRVREAVAAVLAARPLARGRLRITWTSGPGPLGSERHGGSTLVVAASAAPPPAVSPSVVVVPWTRNERAATAGLKTTSYAENVVALRHALAAGAGEALLANTRGELCEGTGSNVVVQLRDGRGRPEQELVTPPLSSGCLAGVTRALLLEWAAQEGLPVVERALPLEALEGAAAVLLTSSLRDVQVQTALDGRPLETEGLPARAAELFARRAAEDLDPR
ncbi:aminotransferase class IV [uncultured Pseudokineococcus sp.]|uniref:aminotransferase class IV n=1 Tax=uncultured Pseudokineococcus sp. TaxID=1642928 RepID=UPI00262E13B6|nr:aminotransferase class IV [uncultured Pseudokineococcus sp.]